VVGAGPAGAAAAITAADRGLRVALVDKARFPRDKTCGDGLTAGALRRLEALGLSLDRLPSYEQVRDVVLVAPDGRQVVLPLPEGGHFAAVVPRAELDDALIALARRRGIDVREGAGVTGVASDAGAVAVTLATGDEMSAPFVIAADGHFSTVRRLLRSGADADLGTWHAFRQYYRGVADTRMWVLFEEDLLPGYAWVFPLPDGRANVGFGVLRGAGVDGKALAARWRHLVDGPRLRAILGDGAEPEDARRAWPIPTRYEPDGLADGRVLFAGDAAAVVDPMTGEGIAQAIETGALAVDAIAAGGAPGAVTGRYRRSVERALGADLRFAGALQRVLARPAGARAALRAVDLSPWTRRNFARWMFEDYPRAQLLTPRRWRRRMLTGPGAYRNVA